MPNIQQNYFHWLLGDNILRDDEPTYLVNLEYGVSIRFDYSDSYFQSFEDFFNSIADVQFLTGERPDKEKLNEILTDAWNFLALSEQEEDNRLQDFDDDY